MVGELQDPLEVTRQVLDEKAGALVTGPIFCTNSKASFRLFIAQGERG